MGSLPGFLEGKACGLTLGTCWSWGLGYSKSVGWRLGGDGLWDPQENGNWGSKTEASVLLQYWRRLEAGLE